MSLLSVIARLFGYGRRKPRRARCSCGHPWYDHATNGCVRFDINDPMGTRECPCNLNRYGKVRPPALVRPEETA